MVERGVDVLIFLLKIGYRYVFWLQVRRRNEISACMGFITKTVLGAIILTIPLMAAGCEKIGDAEDSAPLQLQTIVVDTGKIAKIINATGAVRPEITVLVGSEISGRILDVSVDFNSFVQKGDVLATIDPESLSNVVSQNRAQLEARETDIIIQKASLKRAEVNLAQAERSQDRRRELYKENAISKAQLEETERTMELAVADLELAEARLNSAYSVLEQAKANLRLSEVDLSRTIIRAPMDGVVIERLVDPGQTVAASLSSPELFKIAGDLSKISVDAAVVESDVAELDANDKTTFSVDAYPGRIFEGRVQQLRLKSEIKSNIVTYTAVISADNPDRALMPGMTTNMQITTNAKSDILRIPSSVERFRPTPEQIKNWGVETDEDKSDIADPKLEGRLALIGIQTGRIQTVLSRIDRETEGLRKNIADPTQVWRRTSFIKNLQNRVDEIVKEELNSTEYQDYRSKIQAEAKVRDAQIWVKDGEKMRKKTIGLGLSDGSYTEVANGLERGDLVVTSISSGAKGKGRPSSVTRR